MQQNNVSVLRVLLKSSGRFNNERLTKSLISIFSLYWISHNSIPICPKFICMALICLLNILVV